METANQTEVVVEVVEVGVVVKVVVEVAVGIAVPHTVGGFVLSISVNQPFVTLAPVAAIEPVIVKL